MQPHEEQQATKPEGTRPKSSTGFVGDIETLTTQNRDFRRVLYTGQHCQLVVMSVNPGDHIGLEVHDDTDQFFRVEQGTGEAVIENTRTPIGPSSAIVVPAGAKHDIVNTGPGPLRLYTIYSPPHHPDGVVHHTHADAEAYEERRRDDTLSV